MGRVDGKGGWEGDERGDESERECRCRACDESSTATGSPGVCVTGLRAPTVKRTKMGGDADHAARRIQGEGAPRMSRVEAVWVCMGVYGCVWVCMGAYGCVWVRMGVYGCVWVCV
jgi:hypothetical protein